MPWPPVTAPKVENISSVAAFVETAEDLAKEPFMAEDEVFKISGGGGLSKIYHLGDRTHFRSALISYRRFILNDEPSYYRTVCELLFRHHNETRFVSKLIRSQIDTHLGNNCWEINGVSNEEIIKLWINTVFAHAGLKSKAKKNPITRSQFDELVKEHGVGKFEYAFRLAVRHSAEQMISLCKLAARPALDDWVISTGIAPSFTLSSPFGQKLKEVLADGTTIIRQSSSKYYNEETSGKRFERILARRDYGPLRFFLGHLNVPPSEMALSVSKDSIYEILSHADYSHHEATTEEENNGEGCWIASLSQGPEYAKLHGWTRIWFAPDRQFYASAIAMKFLEKLRLELIETFEAESENAL